MRISFNPFLESVSVSYTVGSYPDHLKYGINDANCGVAQMDRIYFEIFFNDEKCFRNFYPPENLYFKNEDIFQERKINARLLGGIVPVHSDAPWAVNIFYGGDNTICEGVLVTLEWVLTVARCNPSVILYKLYSNLLINYKTISGKKRTTEKYTPVLTLL